MSFLSMPNAPASSPLQPLYEIEPNPARPARREQFRNLIYRQRWLGLSLVVFFVLAGAAATYLIRPYYEASDAVIIEHPSLHEAEITPVEYPPPVDADREMQTELTILGSRAVADPVIAGLQLETRDPDLARTLGKAEQSAAKKGKQLSAATRADLAYGAFSAKLRSTPDKLSSTVHITYGSRSPQIAAAVVNAVAASFMQQTLAARGEAGDEAAHWMRLQVAQAGGELADDDAAVAAFQRQHAYIPLSNVDGTATSALLGRLSDANHAYSAAQAQRIADEATLRSYTGTVVAALPTDLRDPAIDAAVASLGAAQQQLATLATTYRPDFPLVAEARQQVAADQQKLAGLRTQIEAGLEQRLASSQQREQEAAGLVAGLSQQAAAASQVELQFAALKSRADAQRGLVATLRQKLAEVELEASLPPSNIHVLDQAVVPLSPAYPQLPLDLGLGLGLGLLVGAAVMLGRERWSEQLTAVDAVTRGLGPALAPLGMIAEQAASRPGTRALLPSAAGAAAASGYAKVAANLVARAGAPPRALLVTSANDGEGKTTSVCQLGLALAQAGWRTLLVDADVRRPGCHRVFGLPNAPGLLAAQAGRKVAPVAVAARLDLMPCEDEAGQPLQARPMAELLEQWREHYDYVLVDAPPGNATGEAVLLSSLVDGVVVVLRWGRTRLPEAQQVCAELARAHAPLVGTLFNRADPAAPAFRPYRAAVARVQ